MYNILLEGVSLLRTESALTLKLLGFKKLLQELLTYLRESIRRGRNTCHTVHSGCTFVLSRYTNVSTGCSRGNIKLGYPRSCTTSKAR